MIIGHQHWKLIEAVSHLSEARPQQLFAKGRLLQPLHSWIPAGAVCGVPCLAAACITFTEADPTLPHGSLAAVVTLMLLQLIYFQILRSLVPC